MLTNRAAGPTRRDDESGFTLVELLVVTVLTAVISGIVLVSFTSSARVVAIGTERADSMEDIRPAIQRITRELRVANPLVVYSAPDFETQIAADVNRDGRVFRFDYQVTDSDADGVFELTETVTDRTDPANVTDVRTNELVILVDNGAATNPVFRYFDEDGLEIDCAGLTEGQCISALSSAVRIDVELTRLVPGQATPVTVETSIGIRNVRFGA